MKTTQRSFTSLTMIVALVFAGCASFEPGLRLQDLQRPRQPTVKTVQEGVEVSVEEFITASKSQLTFDTNLATDGVLAFLMRVNNGGTATYSVRRIDMKASIAEQPLTSLSPTEAADQAATSEYAGKALAWTLATGPFAILLWPITIGASAVHTRGVNRKIQAYFEASSFQDALLPPKQSTMGFIFFKGTDRASPLEGLIVEAELTEDPSGKKFSYKFELPPLAITK